MKIDLSKYPPGTKFKLCNEKIVTLIGKSFVNDSYVIEYPNGDLRSRNQEGKISSDYSEFNIASVIQPDKYLVYFLTYGKEQKTQIVEDPKRLTEKYFLGRLLGPLTDDDSFFKPKGEGKTDIKDLPYKVLSWSKIEE